MVETYGEALDGGDKATAKAMSAAYKAAMVQTFCIPVCGAEDADRTSHRLSPQDPQSRAAAGVDAMVPRHRGHRQPVRERAGDLHRPGAQSRPPEGARPRATAALRRAGAGVRQSPRGACNARTDEDTPALPRAPSEARPLRPSRSRWNMPELVFPRLFATSAAASGSHVTCAGHRAWVRRHACSVRGCRRTPIECAHVRAGTDGGMGKKPSDKWTISLCRFHHAEQHRIGERAFEDKYSISMAALAMEFARRSPFRSKLSDHDCKSDVVAVFG